MMKKSSVLSILIILNLFIISCTSGLNNLEQGRLSVYVGNIGNNGRYQTDEKTVLPAEFSLKLINNGNIVKKLTFSSNTGITIENLNPGNYEINISGSTNYFTFEGKTTVELLPHKDAIANIKLVKFRKPLYVKEGATSNGNGTSEKPFATIPEAEIYIEDGANAAFYIDGTFDYAQTIDSIKQLYLRKAPDATKAEIKPANKTFFINSTNDFTDITFIDTKISIENNGILSIGGSTHLTTTPDNITYFELKNKKPIVISSPLTSQKVGTIFLSDETIGSQILLAGNKTVNIADECKKFDFMHDAPTKNRYYIDSNGKLAENKPINLTLTNTKPGTTYTCKVKDNESEIISYTYTTPGEIKDGPIVYYFDFGKTYTVEIYEGASADTLIRSQDITIGNENNVSFDVNTYFVSASGDDSKDGSSKATAFKNLSTAISRIGNSKGNIMVVGTINVPTMISIGSGTQLNINGTDNATVNCTGDFMKIETGSSGGSITIQNLKINGNIKLGSTLQRGTLTLGEGAVIENNKTITITNTNSSLILKGNAQAGKIKLCGSDTKVTVSGTLTSQNAGQITVENPSINRVVLSGDAISDNFKKFNYVSPTENDFTYAINSEGKLSGIDINKVSEILTTNTGTVTIRPNINSAADITKLNSALKSSTADVKLSLNFPSTYKRLPHESFLNCTKLVTADISNITEMGNYVFEGCTNLSSVKMPSSGLSTIGGYTFNKCSSLNSISLTGSSYTTIGTGAFDGTGITSLEIPKTVTSISDKLQTSGITTLTAPCNLDFSGNTNITTLTVISSSNSSVVATSAYKDCTGLRTVTFDKSVTEIGANAFEGAGPSQDGTEEWTLHFPAELIKVNQNAFSTCHHFSDTSTNDTSNGDFQPPLGISGAQDGIQNFINWSPYTYERGKSAQ